MRFFALTLMLSAFSLVSYGQKDIDPSAVPNVVKDAFKVEFADATDVEWELKDNHYEAEFEVNDTDYHALLDTSGKIISHKQEIEESELPAEVLTAIQNDFSDYKVDDAEKLMKDGEIYYQVELEKFLSDQEKVFSETGEIRDDISYWN